MFESTLFLDIQARRPACFCENCGGECYAPSLVCIRCERRGRYDAAGNERGI